MVDPTRIGMSAKRLGNIKPVIEQHIGEDKIAGAVALVARKGQIAYQRSFGLAERETGRPMTDDAIFRIYSMTKPITMVAVLTLFERGLLRLTDPVSRFIPEFGTVKVVADEKNPKSTLVDVEQPMTIHHLLTHTSGLTYHFGENGCVEQMYRDTAIFANSPLSEFVDRLAQMPLAFQPGTMWRYSSAHDVAARVVEIVSGKSIATYLQDELFDPLAMNDTGFTVPAESFARLTAEYGLGDIGDPAMTGSKLSRLSEEDPKPRLLRAPGDDIPWERGGHGLFSSAGDYYTFCQMLLNGGRLGDNRILSRKTIELMTTSHVSPEQFPPDWLMPGVGFGLGVRVMLDPAQAVTLGSIGEHGWGGAAGTYYWIDPVEELIGIFMVQFQPGGYFQAGADFRTAAYQAIDD
jgi:CubicO group peptidase (beta-lactamase class C family)